MDKGKEKGLRRNLNVKTDGKLNVFCRLYLYFVAYSVIGWCYEVFLEMVVYRWGFTNRGVLYGPYCPVYGAGMLLFLFTVYRFIKGKSLKKRIVLIPVMIVLCAVVATAVELIASYISEFLIGEWQWQTYAEYKYNFQARIALSPSVRFGLGGALLLYVIQPLFERLADKLNTRLLRVVSAVIAAAMLIDCILTFAK